MAFHAPFPYDHSAALALCEQSSDDPKTLHKLLDRLDISVTDTTVAPSPWKDGLLCWRMIVTVNGHSFPYHGSHHDAQAFDPTTAHGDGMKARRVKARNGLLYSILCCIGADLSVLESDPEDMGMNPDSIADTAKWNEWNAHARKLSKALRLSDAERNSLPS